MSLPRKISDYTVLPLTLPGSDKIAEATHYLYVRQHAPSTPTPEAARSLFAVNIPVDATEAHLRSLFSEIGGGRVESVIFDRDNKRAPQALAVELHDASKKRKRGVATEGVSAPPPPLTTWDRPLRKSGSHAVVVFVDRSSADMALKAAAAVQKEGKTPPVWSDALAPREPALGLPRYLAHQRLMYPDKAALQQSVDAFMQSFAEQEEESRRARSRRRQEPDEDGFVTVTRGGRVAPARQDEAQALLEKKKDKGREMTGFYRWQLREERKQKQQQLLAKFERDKQLVAERKKMRKFMPST